MDHSESHYMLINGLCPLVDNKKKLVFKDIVEVAKNLTRELDREIFYNLPSEQFSIKNSACWVITQATLK